MRKEEIKLTKNSYYFVDDVTKHIPLLDLMRKTPYFQKISKQFGVSISYLCKLVTKLNIPHRNMYSYYHSSIQCHYLHLVEENTFVVITKYNNGSIKEKDYRNTYIGESNYIQLVTSTILPYIMDVKYRGLFNNLLFIKEVPRFDFDISSIKPNINVDDLPIEIQSKLTCQDIADIISNKKLRTTKIISKVKHYANSDSFYIELKPTHVLGRTYDHSLVIPYEFLKTHDWSLVENKMVYGVVKHDAKLGNGNKNFYDGQQKNAPYYDEEVEEIKKIFMDYFAS